MTTIFAPVRDDPMHLALAVTESWGERSFARVGRPAERMASADPRTPVTLVAAD